MRGFWYGRQWKREDRIKGLHETVSLEQLEKSLAAFNSNYKTDPVAAASQLASDLIDPYIISKGKNRWVDTTPRNVRRADSLYAVFPDLKLIHMIRDGRDVASSIVSMNWGPNNLNDALKQWYLHMLEGQTAAKKLPSTSVLTLQLEDLVERDREGSYKKLLDFLEIEDSAKMRKYFDDEMSATNANWGRWQRGLNQNEIASIEKSYEVFCNSLIEKEFVIPK